MTNVFYIRLKNYISYFKAGKFFVKNEKKKLKRPISVSTPESILAVHDMALSNPKADSST